MAVEPPCEDANRPSHYQLGIPRFVDPSIVTSLQNGWTDGVVTSENEVTLVDRDSVFTIEEEKPSENGLRLGTNVSVGIRRGQLICKTDDQRNSDRRECERRQAERERKAAEQKRRKREEAEAFWENYDIPFKWDVAIKGRLSGLSRGSWGDAHAANTVTHLFVQEGFNEGRLERPDEVYLCNNDASYQFEEVRHLDEDDNRYVPAVTCSSCLKLMGRWSTDE